MRANLIKIKSNIDKALLRFAYLVISRNSERLAREFPKLVCFSFDYIGNYINAYGRYENSTLKVLREIVIQQRATSTALDIGANIGNHTVFFSEFFDDVIAFEPNPKTYSLLELNTEFLNNVSCLMIGASSKKAKLDFSINELNMGDCRITSGETKAKQGGNSQDITIEVSPIDAIEEVKNKKIGLIKIDVQGHELDAIRGMLDTIRHHAPIIAFEQEAAEIVDGSSETIKELKKAGYSYFYAIESRRSIVSKNIPALLRIPLELLEIIVCGDMDDAAEFHKVNILDKRQYNMLIASMRAIE